MKGQTNAWLKDIVSGEKISITLTTNQSSHTDLIGAVITVSYAGNLTEYTWEGSAIQTVIPPMTDYTVSYSNVNGYSTPKQFSGKAMDGRVSEVIGTYNTEIVTVNVSAEEGEVSGCEVTISKAKKYGSNNEYTQVEYIESTETQYIDTGFKPNQNTRIVIDFEADVQGSYPKAIFGSRNNKTSAQSSFVFWAISNSAFRSEYGDAYTTNSIPPTGRFLVDKNKAITTINGESFTNTSYTFQSDYNLAIFSIVTPNGVDSRMISMKLYSCQIYDDNVLIRDYVPVTDSNGVAGLWDKVNSVFYQSGSSTAFVAGDLDGDVIATQTTPSASYKIPYGISYTIKSSDVSGYTTPSEQSFTASQPARNVDVVYKEIETGIFIYRIDTDTLISPESWNTNNDYALGVAVITEKCKFVISKSDYSDTIQWGGHGTDIATLTNYTDATIASSDFDGVGNTAKIIAAVGAGSYAAMSCFRYEWTDLYGDIHNSYLGSAGEWKVVDDNYTKINEALELIGAQYLGSGYWTSTEESANYAWVIDPGKEEGPYIFYKGNHIFMRPFFQLP